MANADAIKTYPMSDEEARLFCAAILTLEAAENGDGAATIKATRLYRETKEQFVLEPVTIVDRLAEYFNV